MSLFKFKRFVACFVDSKGDYVGKKVFDRSFGYLGMSKKSFVFLGGSYNIIPDGSSRLELSFNTSLFFDNFIYVYELGNPDPISFRGGIFKPLMNADVYKERLESKLIKDLNSVASGGFKLDWRYILIGLVALGIVLFLINGGSIPGITPSIQSSPVVSDSPVVSGSSDSPPVVVQGVQRGVKK